MTYCPARSLTNPAFDGAVWLNTMSTMSKIDLGAAGPLPISTFSEYAKGFTQATSVANVGQVIFKSTESEPQDVVPQQEKTVKFSFTSTNPDEFLFADFYNSGALTVVIHGGEPSELGITGGMTGEPTWGDVSVPAQFPSQDIANCKYPTLDGAHAPLYYTYTVPLQQSDEVIVNQNEWSFNIRNGNSFEPITIVDAFLTLRVQQD